ncbi:hypothetical protein GGR57DRAFT_484204 [Xylariaceae sp. FL1272]|nr:hypothetical protein GGR57DRAFT_484204 [Xylariaceae sp. FL1272]
MLIAYRKTSLVNMSTSKLLSALSLLHGASAAITVIWQGGSCASPSGSTLDISPIDINTCTLYNFFPDGGPTNGHIVVTVDQDTINANRGLAVFQLPQSQEGQHIQCGTLQGIFHQSGCYDSVTPALDVVTAECDQTGCDNLEGIPPDRVVAEMESSEKTVVAPGVNTKSSKENSESSALVRRQSSCGGPVTCDGCVSCTAQGIRVSPSITCPGQGDSCSVTLTQSVEVTDSYTISAGVADIFTANVETTHSIAVTNGGSQTFTVAPGEAGYVQATPLANCGTMTVHNSDGSVCASAEGIFVLDNQGAGPPLSFVRSN